MNQYKLKLPCKTLSFTFAVASFLSAALFASTASAEEIPAYKDSKLPVEDRVTALMSELTLEEKTVLCHGNFTSGGIPRLGIEPLLMLDGRQGLRPVDDDRGTRTTSLPCALALSCTWDESAAHEFGKVLAEEMLAFDRNVLLAPMLNMVRSPLGGRNFENFGEDPFLVGRIGSSYIKGVQDQKVGACSCLLVANDNEHRRHFTSSNMDERTLREYQMLSYEISVREGNVWSMMTGNNLLNGKYCAQDPHLVQELMKDTVGFDGVMITDWRAAYDTVPTAIAGTDMTTGHCSYVFGSGNLLKAVQAGDVSKELLDDKVRRILRLYVRSGVLDPGSRSKGGVDTPEHREAARRLGAEGMVLLKNDKQLLPIDTEKVKSILITGPAADEAIQGGGSGNVPAAINVSALEGLRTAMKGKGEVRYLPYKVDLRPKVNKAAVEWEQAAAGKKKNNVNAKNGSSIPDAAVLAKAASSADVVVFVAAGTQASEGRDLADMNLPGKQAEAIAALTEANPNVVVVLVNNGAVSLNGWESKVSSIVAMHYAGQATGDALADVLTGKVNPGGKLTYTFAKQLEDYACHALDEWPARLILEKDPVDPGMKPKDRKATHAFTTEYNEGVFSGYRWFDDKKIEPRYAFGYGLSYSTFTLNDLSVKQSDSEISVTCTVKNTGDRTGSEVVQVYVAPPKSSVPRPIRELKGFAKVKLKAGELRQVEIKLSPSALAFYDDASKKWKAEAGDYEIQVGNSSRNLGLKHMISLASDQFFDYFDADPSIASDN